jgi:hypothetical protein
MEVCEEIPLTLKKHDELMHAAPKRSDEYGQALQSARS